MTAKTTNKFSPEVRERAVRMVLDHEGEHSSRWTAVQSIAAKIGCSPHTLLDWAARADAAPAPCQADIAEQRRLDRQRVEARHVAGSISAFDVEMAGGYSHAAKIANRRHRVQRQF